MTSQSSKSTGQASLTSQVTGPEDQLYIQAARALIKTGFLFSDYPEIVYRAFDLNLAQVDVLVALANAPDTTLTCSEIAEKTLVTKGAITGVLDKFEARGLVRRISSRDDRRSFLVRLTTKGVEFFRKFYPEQLRGKRTLFEKAFSPEQMKEFNHLLGLLLRCLEEA
jgi:MarR family transcriptional regulator, 2-MHQ and catechol-resistance regulon repressor